jgi:guanine nucleotide-binding protein G(I)/G(S)/G(T) subunit beta-1
VKSFVSRLPFACSLAKTLPDNVSDIKLRRILKGHSGKVYGIGWAQQTPNLLASAGQDGKLILWDVAHATKVKAWPIHTWPMACALSPSAKLLAVGGLNNVLEVFSASRDGSSAKLRELAGHVGYVSYARFLSEQEAITCSGDATCKLWDVETGVCRETFVGHTGDVMSMAMIASEPNTFVSGACDLSVRVWDKRSPTAVLVNEAAHTADINSVWWVRCMLLVLLNFFQRLPQRNGICDWQR